MGGQCEGVGGFPAVPAVPADGGGGVPHTHLPHVPAAATRAVTAELRTVTAPPAPPTPAARIAKTGGTPCSRSLVAAPKSRKAVQVRLESAGSAAVSRGGGGAHRHADTVTSVACTPPWQLPAPPLFRPSVWCPRLTTPGHRRAPPTNAAARDRLRGGLPPLRSAGDGCEPEHGIAREGDGWASGSAPFEAAKPRTRSSQCNVTTQHPLNSPWQPASSPLPTFALACTAAAATHATAPAVPARSHPLTGHTYETACDSL
mgnify:CR=1 FL=1